MTAGGISIHCVDVSTGRPAEGLAVRLLRVDDSGETELAHGQCGETGLFDHPTVQGHGITSGEYIAEFEVAAYYAGTDASQDRAPFLNVVRYHFGVGDAQQHYHLPFKFTAWGYSLFRGGL
ncbi:hydroxyisourate hydrolase [Epibacterium ulvae]|uniref:hydroxyisourate hydrolase n=1 Tax=Epibacterium ulvae TaxID=1156985 RepID=UPI001BFCB2D3|nr:hydroxyisourate hydrolase [Epibacterium ulvae]MBT8154809.1 hydroxyisourate hydrolase [Epibacterium ulvae]